MPAPAVVILGAAHGRTPVCGPETSNASFLIFVLPIDRRSSIVRVLNESLVDPVSPVVPSPDATDNKPAGDRLSRNDDGPEVPNLCPGGAGQTRSTSQNGCRSWRSSPAPHSVPPSTWGILFEGSRCQPLKFVDLFAQPPPLKKPLGKIALRI